MELTILAAAAAVLFLLVSSRLPMSSRLKLIAVLSVPQLFVFSFGDFSLSTALLCSYSLVGILLWRGWLRIPALRFASLLIFWQALSLLWSPDIRLGVRAIVYAMPFLIVATATYQVSLRRPRVVETLSRLVSLLILLEAVAVILFRFSPALESAYYQSEAARLFTGTNVVTALVNETLTNNVVDEDKAGGVFVNGNVAAAYLGLAGFFSLLGLRRGRRAYLMVPVMLFSAAAATGSKAGLILALVLPATAILWRYMAAASNSVRVAAVLSIVAVAIVFAANGSAMQDYFSATRLGAGSLETAAVRATLWKYGLEAFTVSPLLGQGFGGWHIGFSGNSSATAWTETFPPHNTLIALWSQSGLPAVGLGLLVMASVLRLGVNAAGMKTRARIAGVALLGGSAWLFIQGMGENWGVFGEARQQILLAIMLGYVAAKVRWESERIRSSPMVVSLADSGEQP